MRYIDLTHTFTKDMPVFPGDPASELVQIAKVSKERFMDHRIKTAMHIGTHMDAPAHMFEKGKMISDFHPSKFIAPGVLLDARGNKNIGVSVLPGAHIKQGDIVIIYTGWSQNFGRAKYFKNHPIVSQGLAEKLISLKVSMLGLDIPGPDKMPYNIHKILLKRDILILENLTNLEKLVGRSKFEILALPMKLQANAAPCRVMARVSD